MKKLALFLLFGSFGVLASPQSNLAAKSSVTEINNKVVEIACGECKFKMKGKACDLAIKIDGTPYFVDGKSIDDFGDAHDKEQGFCNAIGKATVTGKIVNNRFIAKTITLIEKHKNKR